MDTFALQSVIVDGPAPLGLIEFDLGSGVTALYGLNGSGKTRLLRAIAGLLRGEEWGNGYVVATLTLRMPNSDEEDEDVAPYELIEAIRAAASERGIPSDTSIDELAMLSLTAVLANSFGGVQDPELRALVKEVLDQGRWILYPAGSSGGNWWITPAFIRDERSPRVCRAIDALLARNQTATTSGGPGDHLFRLGPLMSPYGVEAHPIEVESLRENPSRPYPLLARRNAIWIDAEIAEVVTGNELRPEALPGKTLEVVSQRLDQAAGSREGVGAVVSRNGKSRLRLVGGGDGIRLLTEIVKEISDLASNIFRNALPNAPVLCCEVSEPEEWFDGPPIRWYATEDGTLRIPVDELSDAQIRWACAAAAIALRSGRREVDRLSRTEDFNRVSSSVIDGLEERRRELLELREERRRAEAEREPVEAGEAQIEWDHDYEELLGVVTEPDRYGDDLEPDIDPDDDQWRIDMEQAEDAEIAIEIEELDARIAQYGRLGDGALNDALQKYLHNHPLIPMVVLLDEPEAGLHRAAEESTSRLLVELADSLSVPMIVATHSPVFLRDTRIRHLVVERQAGKLASLNRSLNVLETTYRSLGVPKHEMLFLYRTILLVEGRHDEIVMDGLLGRQLRELRTLVVPLHGGRLMPTAADSRLLIDYSDHHIVALVDNANSSLFSRLVHAARTIAPTDVEQFDATSKEILGTRFNEETGFISRLMRRAFERNELERFHAQALSKADIIEYLPVHVLVPAALSWDVLKAEHERQKKISRFKTWLKVTKGATIDDSAIVNACSSLDVVHSDFTKLIKFLESLPQHGSVIGR